MYYCASKVETAQPVRFNFLYPDVGDVHVVSIRDVLTALGFSDPVEEDPTSCLYTLVDSNDTLTAEFNLDAENDRNSSFTLSQLSEQYEQTVSITLSDVFAEKTIPITFHSCASILRDKPTLEIEFAY
jgi:hypothetical protein